MNEKHFKSEWMLYFVQFHILPYSMKEDQREKRKFNRKNTYIPISITIIAVKITYCNAYARYQRTTPTC